MDMEKEILGLYANSLNQTFSIHEIAKKLNGAYGTVYNAVQRLSQKDILKKKQKGRALLCSLNLDSDQAKSILSAVSIDKKEELKKTRPGLARTCEELTETLKERLKGSLFSLVLFGSYAKGEETKESDLDFLVMVPDKKGADEIIHRESSSLEMRYGKRISPIVITPEMLVTMIKSKGENVGKEALRNNIIFTGFEKFWEIVMEGAR
jgi:predicted nucleotidyltransferase